MDVCRLVNAAIVDFFMMTMLKIEMRMGNFMMLRMGKMVTALGKWVT